MSRMYQTSPQKPSYQNTQKTKAPEKKPWIPHKMSSIKTNLSLSSISMTQETYLPDIRGEIKITPMWDKIEEAPDLKPKVGCASSLCDTDIPVVELATIGFLIGFIIGRRYPLCRRARYRR